MCRRVAAYGVVLVRSTCSRRHAAVLSSGQTVVTDFPDPALISNLERNVQENIPPARRQAIVVEVSSRRMLS